jgi:Protein of unknown function (DUF1329)
MKRFKRWIICLITICASASIWPLTTFAGDIPHPETYLPTFKEVADLKNMLDDPRPVLKDFGVKQVLPPDLYKSLTYDIQQMKNLWAELVGFRAPEVVGKIAPEIKPGKYTYKDLEKHPGFKDILWPDLYNRIKPGGPPHIGNIPEFEIVPTRQYYWALPIGEATKKNLGKSKLDAAGYMEWKTWLGGYPFPKPSGKSKAIQIMYNIEKRYTGWGGNYSWIGWQIGFTKGLRIDYQGTYLVRQLRGAGRVMMPPYGYLDDRAERRGEFKFAGVTHYAPRDIAGTGQSSLFYLNPEQADLLMVYIPSLRRVRKLSATDTQDPVMGQDVIYDDQDGWHQRLTATRYPYKSEVLEEREYLVIAPTLDGSEYISSEDGSFHNVRMERRPIWVVQLLQQDPNYVYSKRILYVDRETLNFYHLASYDQKGRLYRTYDSNGSFLPEMGMFTESGALLLYRDHIDLHSGASQAYQLPTAWDREDVSMRGLVTRGK